MDGCTQLRHEQYLRPKDIINRKSTEKFVS